MFRKLRPRSAYDLMAAIAFFIAVAGGTAFAANTIGSSDVIDDSLLGADIQGKNASSTRAGVNGTITGADVYGQPSVPAVGQPSINGALTGSDIADLSIAAKDLTPAQAWQNIQDPDDGHCQVPGYFSCVNAGTAVPQWRNDSATENNNAAYYKDPYGVVHIKGVVCFTDPAVNCAPPPPSRDFSSRFTILQLPSGYRPAKEWSFHTETGFGEALIVVGPDGKVDALHGNFQGVSLDGLEFRACGAPGSEACPSGGSS
jgi:hypothetical protein